MSISHCYMFFNRTTYWGGKKKVWYKILERIKYLKGLWTNRELEKGKSLTFDPTRLNWFCTMVLVFFYCENLREKKKDASFYIECYSLPDHLWLWKFWQMFSGSAAFLLYSKWDCGANHSLPVTGHYIAILLFSFILQ